MPDSNSKEVFDIEEALNNVGGSQELLCELSQTLQDELPGLLSLARKALKSGDAKAVNAATHSIKGSVTPFAAKLAYDAAWKLEETSSKGDLNNADENFKRLDSELKKLVSALDQALSDV